MFLILDSPYESDWAGGSDERDLSRNLRSAVGDIGGMVFALSGIFHRIPNRGLWWVPEQHCGGGPAHELVFWFQLPDAPWSRRKLG